MLTIGGKTKTDKPTQPQFIVQLGDGLNKYAQLKSENAETHIVWIGDPNAATKFDSKYAAKARIREMDNVPASRIFRKL